MSPRTARFAETVRRWWPIAAGLLIAGGTVVVRATTLTARVAANEGAIAEVKTHVRRVDDHEQEDRAAQAAGLAEVHADYTALSTRIDDVLRRLPPPR